MENSVQDEFLDQDNSKQRQLYSSWCLYLGLGLTLLSMEIKNLPTIQNVVLSLPQDVLLLCLVKGSLLVVLLALTFVFRKKLHLRVSVGIVLGISLIWTARFLFEWKQVLFSLPVSSTEYSLLHSLDLILDVVFIVIWFREICPKGLLETAKTIGVGSFIAGLFVLITTFMQVTAALILLALSPVFSAICFFLYRHFLAPREDQLLSETPTVTFLYNTWTGNYSAQRHIVLLSCLVLLLISFSLVFGYIHFSWVEFQDGAVFSTLMQIGIGCGSMLAGLFIVFFTDKFFSSSNIKMYLLVTVSIVVIALWLTSYIESSYIVFYLMLLNFAQKSLYFFIFVQPFFIKTKSSIVFTCTFLFFSFEVGKYLSYIINALILNEHLDALVVFPLIALLGSSFVMLFLEGNSKETSARPLAANKANILGENEPQNNRFYTACLLIAADCNLTQREYDAFILLARGRTASYIADSMIIAFSTAKVYVRNIYQKIGVHNQQDLITFVEAKIATIEKKPGVSTKDSE